ncbi:unnamed protein product [Parascedosporium putredinis]|uniref:Serum paraoxonase/arylesterase n=1 Tax=Parascedosporium putredinis TaxID=1442378 RepID=A0A9P1HD26_9PEZI|nr:unnamed protein product [Parascedosporium putredinis]CAI8003914.1 unnamed protein product [Parascedosporium putredinis]
MGLLSKLGLIAAALIAVGFQVYLKQATWLGLGIGRSIQPLSDFPYDCRRIDNDPRLQACEDMWLSENSRVLYLACSDPIARTQWLPNNHKLNVTGRSQKDAIVALQIDAPSGKSFEYTTLQPSNYAGTAGDGLLSLVGMTGVDVSVDGEEDRVELLLVNARPSLDSVGQISLSQAAGANATIEVFEVRGRHSATMNHLHTVAHKDITTPNNVALASGSRTRFYTTNDHGAHKVGLMAHLGGFLNVGNVVLCTVGQGCRVVSEGHKFPNGLAQHGGFVYVPSSMTGVIQVYRIKEDDELEKVEDIVIDYSLDNLSVDANGDIYVAAFPKGIDILLAFNDPLHAKPRSTIFRVRKGQTEATRRLFLSGVISPFITVCEPRP